MASVRFSSATQLRGVVCIGLLALLFSCAAAESHMIAGELRTQALYLRGKQHTEDVVERTSDSQVEESLESFARRELVNDYGTNPASANCRPKKWCRP